MVVFVFFVVFFVVVFLFFFFNDTATTEIYTLSLHDALPIWGGRVKESLESEEVAGYVTGWIETLQQMWLKLLVKGRKTTFIVVRFAPIVSNSLFLHFISIRFQQDIRSEEHTSELQSQFRISYAVFCLKKKKKKKKQQKKQKKRRRRKRQKRRRRRRKIEFSKGKNRKE